MGGCLLHGVCAMDHSVTARARRQTAGSSFTDFMNQKAKIHNAVLNAFRLCTIRYSQLYQFGVKMSESTQSTEAEKLKLALSTVNELGDSERIKLTLAVLETLNLSKEDRSSI